MRADRLLVERGLFESRARAQAAIAAGLVTANGQRVAKPSQELDAGAVLDATPVHPWASRGGLKLAAALDAFPLQVDGRVCLDVGASTGGFTEVLLARGARRVYAVDVGHGQLHPRLRSDPRVVSREATDIRSLRADSLDPRPDLVSVDVSFVSLKVVLGPALAVAAAGRVGLIALIKPQFEAGRGHLKKGIVRDPAVHPAVCDDISAFASSLGCRVHGIIASPILGGDGNTEFLIAATRET